MLARRAEKRDNAGTMRKLAHIGIPTDKKPAKASHLAEAKLFVTDPADTKNNIEFLYFEEGSPMPEILKKATHIAYVVDDIEAELEGAEILMPPFEPFPNLKAAFIIEDGGVPVERMQKF